MQLFSPKMFAIYTTPSLDVLRNFSKSKIPLRRKRVDVWVGGDCKSNLVPAAWARTGHQRGRLAAAAADEHFVVFLFLFSSSFSSPLKWQILMPFSLPLATISH